MEDNQSYCIEEQEMGGCVLTFTVAVITKGQLLPCSIQKRVGNVVASLL